MIDPIETARRYNAIAGRWAAAQAGRAHMGLEFADRAIALAPSRGRALDVGCGTGGALLARLEAAAASVAGIDLSDGMLRRARLAHPAVRFLHADIRDGLPSSDAGPFDIIVAWDSLFHLPHADQRPVVARLCRALAPGGVLLFTAGGVDGEVSGPMHGQVFHYSSLDGDAYLAILRRERLRLVLFDRDQYPDEHVIIMGIRQIAAAAAVTRTAPPGPPTAGDARPAGPTARTWRS